MNEWNIQARAHRCQACDKTFSDKETYHTLLYDGKEGPQRQDVCANCWGSQYSEGSTDRKGFISYWHGIYQPPPPPPPDPIQKENAESLLRKLIELNDPQYAAAGYILAVMLERKRLLKVKEQFQKDGQRVFVYEHPRSGDIFTVPDPDLQLDQLEVVQHDVAQLLEHGLNPPQDASNPTAAPEPVEPAATPSADADPSPADPSVLEGENQVAVH